MGSMVLPKGSLLSVNGNALTEHNRGAVNVEVNRIENSKRMHDGTLRKVVIADKLKWTVSWGDIPNTDAATVDGKWGGRSIEDFYKNTPGVFTFNIKESGTGMNYNAVITSFDKKINKRGAFETWDISLTIEEV